MHYLKLLPSMAPLCLQLLIVMVQSTQLQAFTHEVVHMSKISQITFFDLHVVECHHLVTHTSVVSLSTSVSQLPFLTLHSCCRATFCCFSCSICSVCMCTKCICALYLELTYCTSVSFCSWNTKCVKYPIISYFRQMCNEWYSCSLSHMWYHNYQPQITYTYG